MDFILSLPEVLQAFLVAAGIVALVAGGIFLVIRLRQNFDGQEGTIITIIQAMLAMAVEAAYAEAHDRLLALDPEAQREAVKELAKGLYANLPEYVVFKVNNRDLVVPLKYLLGEEVFVAVCLKGWEGSEVLLAELKRLLEDLYAQWKATGYEVPSSRSFQSTAWIP